MLTQFRLYIVRHGETEWNRTRRIQGQLDVPLNENGRKQAKLVADALKDIPFVRAFSSDLQRASTTAECILQHHPDIVLERHESIRERVSISTLLHQSSSSSVLDFCVLAHQYMGELQGEFSPSKTAARSMEKMADFAARCMAWYLRSILDHMVSALEGDLPAEPPQNLLVVSHGAWIGVLLSALRANGLLTCGEGVEIGHCLNTGVSIVEYRGMHASKEDALVGNLIQYSDIEHLIQDLRSQEVNADVLEDRGRRQRV